jgi:NAD(P)-dependent dehydrogenase (short-subunit alcohol dehydrogenase family)
MNQVPRADGILTADLSSIEETRNLAAGVNELGTFDAVIHNAGVYKVSNRDLTKDGLPILFAVNSLAPYILTALIKKPERLIYLSSGMHGQGNGRLDNLIFGTTARNAVTYSDTKLHIIILCMAVARKWPEVYANSVDPGWVPTKMGGAGAPDNLEKGFQTQAWLAVSNDKEARVSGRHFYHKKEKHFLPVADDPTVQSKFLALCERISGLPFPL